MSKQKSPRPVRLYPPVEEGWRQLNQEANFNFFVNYCLAEKMGLQVDLEPYRRKDRNNDG